MQKQLMNVAVAVCIVIATLAFYFFYDNQDETRIAEIGSSPYSAEFYIKDSQIDSQKSFAFFTELCEEKNISILKVSYEMDNGTPRTVYSGIFCTGTFPQESLRVLNGRLPSAGAEFMASYDTADALQTGSLFEFGGNNQLRVDLLEQNYVEKGRVDGAYRIVSNAPIDSKQILEAIAVFYGVDYLTLITPSVVKSVDSSGLVSLGIGALVFIALIVVLLSLSLPVARIKEIGSQKLLGWSSLRIWRSYIWQIPLVACSTALLTEVILLLKLDGFVADFFAMLALIWVITLGGFILITSLMMLVIFRQKTSAALKQFFSLRSTFVASCLLKTAYLSLLAAFALAVVPMIGLSITEYKTQQAWLNHSNLYVISAFDTTDEDLDSMANGDRRLDEKFGSAEVYHIYNTEFGALYATSTDYLPLNPRDINSAPDTSSFQTMLVNPNYLKAYPLYDEDGKQIAVEESEGSRVKLVPLSRAGETWESSAESGTLTEEKTIFYKDDVQLFSFASTVANDKGNYLTSPIIFVLTETNMYDYERWNLIVTGADACVKFPLDEAGIERLSKRLDTTALAQNNIKFDTIANVMAERISFLQSSLSMLFAIYAAIFIAGLVASVFLIQLLLLSKKRWLFVARLNGVSFYNRYQTEILFFAAINALALLGVTAGTGGFLAIPLLLVAILLDAATIAFFIHRLERKSLVSQLKGA